MNKENKLYTIQFSHRLTTNFASSPRAAIVEPGNCGFREIPKKDRTPRKVQTARQERTQTHRNKKEKFMPPCQPPFLNWACHLWYGIFPLASLGCLPGCIPSQLLDTCSLAEYGRLEINPWFHSNNWKHPSYQHSSCTEFKT